MENCIKKGVVATAVAGVVAALVYIHIKANPDILCDMKMMAKDVAKKTYDKLDDLD